MWSPAPSAVTSTSPGTRPRLSRSAFGITNRPALSMVERMPLMLPSGWRERPRPACSRTSRPGNTLREQGLSEDEGSARPPPARRAPRRLCATQQSQDESLWPERNPVTVGDTPIRSGNRGLLLPNGCRFTDNYLPGRWPQAETMSSGYRVDRSSVSAGKGRNPSIPTSRGHCPLGSRR